MNYKLSYIIAFIFSCAINLYAQSDTLGRFYQVNRTIEIEDFGSLHLPLDGKEAAMIPFRKDQLFGFVANDEIRDWLIPPKYKTIFTVYQEGAIVQDEYGFGLLTAENKWSIPAGFDNLYKEREALYHGLIFHGIDTLQPEGYDLFIFNVYFDAQGKELFRERAHDQKSFNAVDSLAWFRYGTQFRIRSASGKLWKQFEYDADKEFIGIENNLLIYKEEQEEDFLYSAYDIHDQLIFQLPFYDYLTGIVQLSKEEFIYKVDGSIGFCNSKGEDKEIVYRQELVLFPWEEHQSFYKDYYPVKLERETGMGLMDRTGKMILDFEYTLVAEVVDDLVFCTPKASRFGQLKNLKGDVVTDSIWLGHNYDLERTYELLLNQPITFHEGLMVHRDFAIDRIDTLANGKVNYYASDQHYYFYLDKHRKQKIILDTAVIFAGIFQEGLAPVIISGKGLGFIDKQGKIVIDGAYELTRVGEGPIPLVLIPYFKGGFAYIPSHNLYIDKKGKELLAYSEKYDLEGVWKEVRSEEIGIDIGIPMPSVELVFEKTGVVQTKWYTSPKARYLSGHYELKDSVLIFNPKEEYKFDRYLNWDEFIIEKRSQDELIMRSNRRPSRRHYFLSKEKFDQFTPEEIITNYSYTANDTLKMIAREKEKAALKELRKNDLSIPMFPGGYDAMKAFIESNLVYPENHTTDRLIRVNFEVDADGKLLNIKSRTNKVDAYTIEAERLVRSMPNWLPYRRDNIPKKAFAKVDILFKRKQ